MIIAADFSMTGLSHIYFNTAFFNIFRNIYGKPIVFYGEEQHLNLISKSFLYGDLVLKPFRMKSRFGLSILFQDILCVPKICKILFRLGNNDIMFVLNRLPITMLCCNILNVFLNRRIIHVLHGETEYLVNPLMIGGTKYYYKLFKLAYWFSGLCISYLFLGESIKRKVLAENVSFGKASLLVIDHPYDYDLPSCLLNNFASPNIIIGIIGSAMVRKNSHYLSNLVPLILNKNIIFKVTGKVEDSLVAECIRNNIEYNKERLSNEEYVDNNLSMHYSLCFYDSNVNLALASGSFFDSIKYCKPILALKGNPYVDYYFEKLGDIGFRFSSVQAMANFINQLSSNEFSHYEVQYLNLKRAQEVLSLGTIANSLKSQL